MPQPAAGLFNIHKPTGWSSRDVVNRLERLTKSKKVGHAGTLDPLAEGVLVVCVGGATRLLQFVQEGVKEYHATFQLGGHSDTDDVTGHVTPRDVPEIPTLEQIETALQSFRGEILQTPPQYSAVHVDGQRAYALARAGQAVDLAPRKVRIDELEILRFDWPLLELRMTCSAGTYVRSVGRDLGEMLGCGAYMTTLIRTRVGPFTVSDAVSINDLTKENVEQAKLSPLTALADWPQWTLSSTEAWDVAHGRTIRPAWETEPAAGTRWALVLPGGTLAALTTWTPDRGLVPQTVFIQKEDLPVPAADAE